MTALLPTPRSRALNALALQTDAAERDDERSSLDLSSFPIPIPAMRPADLGADAKLEIASIGPIGMLPDKRTSALPTYSGFKPFAAAHRASPEDANVIASLPMTACWEEADLFGSISDGALMNWALHPPGAVIGMRAPRISRRTVHNPDAASGTNIIRSPPLTGSTPTGLPHPPRAKRIRHRGGCDPPQVFPVGPCCGDQARPLELQDGRHPYPSSTFPVEFRNGLG
ncbi:hypothetical protein AJ87_37900 [Rhizobium yanglingense]|nr:hypothetical protein AJ87_37900 [Rhizobium yanglingense]